MPSRRAALKVAATASIGATAGCLGFVAGDGPLEFESERAAPSDATLEETGFDAESIEEESVEEVIDVVVERELHATFWVSTYTKEADLPGTDVDTAVFTAVSIPGMEVLGSQQNPIADMDNEELFEEFRDDVRTEHGDVSDVTRRSTDELAILGDDREVDVFEAVAERHGETYDVLMEVTSFEHEDDILVLVGIYPADVTDDPPIDDLMASVDHPVD